MGTALTFFWWMSAPGGRAVAVCKSRSETDLLACLLMDDGGLSFDTTIDYIREGISRIDAVRDGTLAASDWDREDWGTTFTADEARIYSMYVDTCCQTIDTSALHRSLIAWLDFIQSVPGEEMTVTVDV